jgi:hypothetical protein
MAGPLGKSAQKRGLCSRVGQYNKAVSVRHYVTTRGYVHEGVLRQQRGADWHKCLGRAEGGCVSKNGDKEGQWARSRQRGRVAG